ncbi:MAG: DegT/DnrJ/EryC1/StrS aminotransferase family protein [Clostridia bacterium]
MQFIDLKAQYQKLKTDINHEIQNVLDSASFIMGKEVSEFETMLSEFTSMKHSITCANGTDALQMVFMAYEIGQGDAVFCPDITFIASVEPACMLGATPVFCDIEMDTYNLCPKSLEEQIKNVISKGKHKPRAVVAVDFLGNPCKYDEITSICKKYDLLLIEDSAQGFGSIYKNKKACTFGDISTTSFFPAKPLGCYGDGGAIFTNNDEIADILTSIRVHGKGASKYENVRVGVNSRLDTIQAGILKVKLKAFENFEVDARQNVAKRYDNAFKNHFVTPFVDENSQSIYAQYALLAKNEEERDKIIKHLTENNIPNMVYYPYPQHVLEVYKGNIYNDIDFKNSIEYCKRTFSLPMHPYLEVEEQNLIINTVLEGF